MLRGQRKRCLFPITQPESFMLAGEKEVLIIGQAENSGARHKISLRQGGSNLSATNQKKTLNIMNIKNTQETYIAQAQGLPKRQLGYLAEFDDGSIGLSINAGEVNEFASSDEAQAFIQFHMDAIRCIKGITGFCVIPVCDDCEDDDPYSDWADDYESDPEDYLSNEESGLKFLSEMETPELANSLAI